MPKKMEGIFISFEGTDGSGKSTLIHQVSQLLGKLGYHVVLTREPGGSPLAEKIREITLKTQMNPRAELFLYEAARAEHLTQMIQPALSRGQIVLCDRFTDSTLAYQSRARGLPWNEVKSLNRIATSGTTPHLTVLLDIDPQVGLLRAKDPNRFEAEGIDFQKRVRSGYLKARSEDPKRWLTLKINQQTPEQLAEAVLSHLFKRFKTQLKKLPKPLSPIAPPKRLPKG